MAEQSTSDSSGSGNHQEMTPLGQTPMQHRHKYKISHYFGTTHFKKKSLVQNTLQKHFKKSCLSESKVANTSFVVLKNGCTLLICIDKTGNTQCKVVLRHYYSTSTARAHYIITVHGLYLDHEESPCSFSSHTLCSILRSSCLTSVQYQ